MLRGVFVFGVFVTASLFSTAAEAQDRPVFVSGAGVPPAYVAGNWKQTAEKMKAAYKLYKAANWDYTKVPVDMWKHQDQKYAENKPARSQQVTGYVIPTDPVYREVAFWCETYYRQNLKVYKHRTVCDPKGFFLVMYRDGVLQKVDAKDVRMIPHPTVPSGMIQVFPRMKQYDIDLPMLPAFSNQR